MFWIKINQQKLQLPDDFRVDLIIENPMFLQDRIPVPYTTSYDVIRSPYNNKLLEHPSRVNKREKKYYYEDAEIGFGAIPMYKGTFITREIGDRISGHFQAASQLDNLKKNMNELDLGTITLGVGDYDMRTNPQWAVGLPGPTVDLPMAIYRSYWVDAHDNELEYAAAPIKVAGAFYPTKFFDNDLLYINSLAGQDLFFNAWADTFGNVIPLATINFGQDVTRYGHGVMFPQMRAAYFVHKLLGIADDENPFRSTELAKLVLTSHHHPNFRDDIVQKWAGVLVDNDYPAAADPGEFMQVDIASYQPALAANEAFKALLNMVCGTLFRYKDRYFIKLHKDIFQDSSFEDWDKLLANKLKLSREDAQPYLYGYQAHDETAPAVDPEFVLTSIEDLIDAPVNSETQEQVYFISTTGQLILKKTAPKLESSDPDTFIYEVRHNGLSRAVANEGYQITSSLSPLKMAPTWNLASYLNTQIPNDNLAYLPLYDGDRSDQYRPSVMLYHGKIANPLTQDFLIPYLSFHNYSPDGTKLGNLSLAWEGPDGLLANYHQEFKAWIESDRLTAFGNFLLRAATIRKLDVSKKVNVRNKLWWIRKVTIPLTKKRLDPAEVDLIEAPIPS